MRGPLTAELSSYSFSPLREGDFPLYKGSGDGLSAILLVAGEETSPGYLERLEHEYALRAELDVAWAARPVALSRYRGRLTLVLEDPGGEPLDGRLGPPLEIPEFLHIADWRIFTIGDDFAASFLILSDVKPSVIDADQRNELGAVMFDK